MNVTFFLCPFIFKFTNLATYQCLASWIVSSLLESCSRMEALIQELIYEAKAVVSEKVELDFRDMSELKAHLHFSAIRICFPKQRSQFNKFISQQSASLIQLSIKILMGTNLKYSEMKKFKFDYQTKSKLNAFPGNSGSSRFHRKLQVQQLLHQLF